MGKIILTGQTKGGVGKSLLAANIAVSLAHSGQSVALLDADAQKTTARWSAIRKERGTEPEIKCFASRIGQGSATEYRDRIRGLAERFDTLVIDSGGFDSGELRVALVVCDSLIVPCGPTVSEIWGLADFDELVGAALAKNPDMKRHVVINRSPPLNFHGQTEQAREAMKSLKHLPFSGLVMTDRQTYQATYQEGCGMADMKAESMSIVKARNEMRGLVRLAEEGEDVRAA